MSSGELLKMLQKSARNGSLLSSCEPEVKELMHQLDLLISQHQKECQQQANKTKLQLQLRDDELTTLRISLHERTNQLERLRVQSLDHEQEHRARQADCDAQLVRVKSELSRLRHSYEQLRSKRSHQNKTSGGTNYKQECHSLRQQLTEMKVKEREMERQGRELREGVKKRDEHVEGLEVERRQSEQSLAYLQETLKNKQGQIRKLEEEVGVARMSTGCHGELQQVQQKLRAQLQLEQELRESLRRAREEGSAWREEVAKMKDHQSKQENEVIRKLEARVHKLEQQLRESQHDINGANSVAVRQFREKTEAFLQSPIVAGAGDGESYVALEPVCQRASSDLDDSLKWGQLLDNVLGKHFDQLDCSLQKILSPN